MWRKLANKIVCGEKYEVCSSSIQPADLQHEMMLHESGGRRNVDKEESLDKTKRFTGRTLWSTRV